jgi:hypothetical protein
VPGQTRTIKYLSNWLNRNAFTGNAFALSPGGFFPAYTFLAGNIRFYPPQCVPAAPWRLYYTPMWTTLANPTTRNIVVNVADTPSNNGGLMRLALANGAFTTADIGSTITVTWAAPNASFNVTASAITAVLSATFIQVAAAWPGGSFTGPAAGTVVETTQPAGTTPALPSIMASWSEYPVVYAAMAINIDRQRPIGELERKLQALKARVASILGNRQEEPQQPPLTRDSDGGVWGGGWT